MLALVKGVSLGLFIIVVHIPFVFNKIPPNYWLGLRHNKILLSNEHLWYIVHHVVGIDFIVIGFITIITSFLTYFLYRNRFSSKQIEEMNICVFVLLVFMSILHIYWLIGVNINVTLY